MGSVALSAQPNIANALLTKARKAANSVGIPRPRLSTKGYSRATLGRLDAILLTGGLRMEIGTPLNAVIQNPPMSHSIAWL